MILFCFEQTTNKNYPFSVPQPLSEFNLDTTWKIKFKLNYHVISLSAIQNHGRTMRHIAYLIRTFIYCLKLCAFFLLTEVPTITLPFPLKFWRPFEANPSSEQCCNFIVFNRQFSPLSNSFWRRCLFSLSALFFFTFQLWVCFFFQWCNFSAQEQNCHKALLDNWTTNLETSNWINKKEVFAKFYIFHSTIRLLKLCYQRILNG